VTETPAHVGRRFLDVAKLPAYAFGYRAALWWGVMILIVIETMMFSLLVTSYLYSRGREHIWPPAGAENAPLWVTGGSLLVLLLAGLPLIPVYRKAIEGRLRVLQLGFVATTILSLAAAAARGYEFASIGYRWNSHAYGSLVWGIYFMHALHLVAGVCENIVMTALLYKGPIEKKHMLDIRLSCIYWWFVVVVWIPLWALIVFDGRQ
jgi:cytochrome c oxidase subunit III